MCSKITHVVSQYRKRMLDLLFQKKIGGYELIIHDIKLDEMLNDAPLNDAPFIEVFAPDKKK